MVDSSFLTLTKFGFMPRALVGRLVLVLVNIGHNSFSCNKQGLTLANIWFTHFQRFRRYQRKFGDHMTQQMLALILYLLFKVEEEDTDHMMQF